MVDEQSARTFVAGRGGDTHLINECTHTYDELTIARNTQSVRLAKADRLRSRQIRAKVMK